MSEPREHSCATAGCLLLMIVSFLVMVFLAQQRGMDVSEGRWELLERNCRLNGGRVYRRNHWQSNAADLVDPTGTITPFDAISSALGG